MSLETIVVDGPKPYAVHIGHGALSALESELPQTAARVLIVHQPAMTQVAESLRERLGHDRTVLTAEVPDAEGAKRVEVAAFLWGLLGQSDFTRTDVIIGLGGGAVTDLAGFVAATWLRGIQVIQVPTSVLGMVDAAVGGKTGINTTEGKNLVGAFWAPRAVIADFQLLDSLPKHELVTGYAEVVKVGLSHDTKITERILSNPEVATDPTSDAFVANVVSAIRYKAEVVGEDFTEHGRREFLNYGHTFGHAIEYVERYQWRHGAAVSVGMVYAAELAGLLGLLEPSEVELHRQVLTALDLPTSYRPDVWESLLTAMHRDKKARGNMLRFVLLDGIAHPKIQDGVPPELLFTAYQSVTGEA